MKRVAFGNAFSSVGLPRYARNDQRPAGLCISVLATVFYRVFRALL